VYIIRQWKNSELMDNLRRIQRRF